MSFFHWRKRTDEQTKAEQQPDTLDPAPWLGRVGDGDTIQSGERIARELRELLARRHDADVDTDAPVSADPEMPIPNPQGDPRKR